MENKTLAIRSVLSKDKWFIFRQDGTEVTVIIKDLRIKKSDHKLTPEEVKYIIENLKNNSLL